VAHQALTRWYARLLRLYPRGFRAEFGNEMQAVFAQTLDGVEGAGLSPAQRRFEMARLFVKETWDLPAAVLSAVRFESNPGRQEAPAGASGGPGAPPLWTGQGEPWGRALLGAVPFLLFGLAYAIQALAELGAFGEYADRGWIVAKYAPPPVYFIVAIGLLAGWLKRFPRWSIAYLGATLYFGWQYSNGRYYGVVYGWRAWIPPLVVALVALLVTRSLRPLGRLVRGVWDDWTQLSFLLYAFALPMATIVFFDSDWGTLALVGLVVDTMLLAAGAVLYLRLATTLHRVLALQVAMFSLYLRNVLMGGWYPAEHVAAGERVSPVAMLTLVLGWGGLMLLPGLVGLLRRLMASRHPAGSPPYPAA
jgi:hypothetical protein